MTGSDLLDTSPTRGDERSSPEFVAAEPRPAPTGQIDRATLDAGAPLRPGEVPLLELTVRVSGGPKGNIGLARLTSQRVTIILRGGAPAATLHDIPLRAIESAPLRTTGAAHAHVELVYRSVAGRQVLLLNAYQGVDGKGRTRYTSELLASAIQDARRRLDDKGSAEPAASAGPVRGRIDTYAYGSTAAGYIADTTSPEQAIIEAEASIANRNDPEALALLARVPPESPLSLRARTLETVALWNAGLVDRAQTALEVVSTDAANDPGVSRLLAWFRLVGMGSETSVEGAARAWAHASAAVGAADLWASDALAAGDPAEIEAAATRVEQYRPSAAALMRGHLAMQRSDWQLAVANYEQVDQDDMDYRRAVLNRAAALVRLNRHAEARRVILSAAERWPGESWLVSVTRRVVDRARLPVRVAAGALAGVALMSAELAADATGYAVAAAAALLAVLVAWHELRGRVADSPQVQNVYDTSGPRWRRLARPFVGGLVLGAIGYSFVHTTLDRAVAGGDPLTSVAGALIVVAAFAWLWRHRLGGNNYIEPDLGFTWTRPRRRAVATAEG